MQQLVTALEDDSKPVSTNMQNLLVCLVQYREVPGNPKLAVRGLRYIRNQIAVILQR